MVDREINLMSAHRISEIIEEKIQNQMPEVTHATIHLEPYITVPKNFNVEDTVTEEKIKKIVEDYPDVKKVGRILSLKFENILKIDIDCSLIKNYQLKKFTILHQKLNMRLD